MEAAWRLAPSVRWPRRLLEALTDAQYRRWANRLITAIAGAYVVQGAALLVAPFMPALAWMR